MRRVKSNFRKSVKLSFGIFLCAGALAACQTTYAQLEKKDVTLDEIHIVLPDSLLKTKGFKIERVTVETEGSFVGEQIQFTGGFFNFSRYFRGGFSRVAAYDVDTFVAKNYKPEEVLKQAKAVEAPIGTMYYSTAYNTERNVTCVVGIGNQGRSLPLRGGPGYEGRTMGEYCEPGKKPDLDRDVLQWLKKIKLRS